MEAGGSDTQRVTVMEAGGSDTQRVNVMEAGGSDTQRVTVMEAGGSDTQRVTHLFLTDVQRVSSQNQVPAPPQLSEDPAPAELPDPARLLRLQRRRRPRVLRALNTTPYHSSYYTQYNRNWGNQQSSRATKQTTTEQEIKY
ncbi:putative protein ORF50 [Dissostichus eleginoides]|uniref:Uncharacterized protein n=1 Tax=Dissostichus eleginoides TaxID=100907 RepID=A0AAD9ESJ9_DISEL|nr:putative protein ORF50 [Dissostichus eleginoides]